MPAWSDSWDSTIFLKTQKHRYERYAQVKARTCYFCGARSNGLTTGHLPDLGAIWKCADCKDEYDDLVQAIEEELR